MKISIAIAIFFSGLLAVHADRLSPLFRRPKFRGIRWRSGQWKVEQTSPLPVGQRHLL